VFSEARRRLYSVLESAVGTGKVAHMAWVLGKDPDLPWAVYYDEPDGKGADNENWCVKHMWTVELHELASDSDFESSVFDELSAAYGYVEPPTGSNDESDGHYICVFTFSEIERM
jgi:hypothetical protein